MKPEPLTPPDCDLRSMPSMLLDVGRLRDSDLAGVEDAEIFRCGVLGWCAAWHQVPAGSLPDDDVKLARLLGYGRDVNTFRSVRAKGGMRGWILCSDGRLYHPVVCEKALEAMKVKNSQRARTDAATKARTEAAEAARKAKEEAEQTPPQEPIEIIEAEPTVTVDVTCDVTMDVTSTNRTELKEREEKGRKEEYTPLPPPTSTRRAGAVAPSEFDEFWKSYPRKQDKGHAEKAFKAACKISPPNEIITGLRCAKWNPDPKYIPLATTWLNGKRWMDEVDHRDPVLVAAGYYDQKPRDPIWDQFDEPQTNILRIAR